MFSWDLPVANLLEVFEWVSCPDRMWNIPNKRGVPMVFALCDLSLWYASILKSPVCLNMQEKQQQ